MIHPAECAFTFPGRQFIISIKPQEMQGLHTALDNIIGRCKRCCEMRTSVTLKTLIIISAAMIITVLSFSMGYFKAKMDFQKFTDTYTVSVEETAHPAPENETPAEQENVNNSPLVNINTATAAELESLPGIGPALAARIVEYREEYGEFQSRYNLMDVSGIGTGIYEKIKDSICVNDQNQEEMEK